MNEETQEIDEVVITPHEQQDVTPSKEPVQQEAEQADEDFWEDEESVTSDDSRFNHLEAFVSKLRDYEDPRFEGKRLTPRSKGNKKMLRRRPSTIIAEEPTPRTAEENARWIMEDPSDLSTLPLQKPEEPKPTSRVPKPKVRQNKPEFPIKKAVLEMEEQVVEPEPKPKKIRKRRKSRKVFDASKPKSIIEQYYGYDPMDTTEILSKNIPSSIYSKNSRLPPTRKSKPESAIRPKTSAVISRSSSFRVQTGNPITITQFDPLFVSTSNSSPMNTLAPPPSAGSEVFHNKRYSAITTNLTDSFVSIPKPSAGITIQVPVVGHLARPQSPSKPDVLPPVNTKLMNPFAPEPVTNSRVKTAPASIRTESVSTSPIQIPDSPTKHTKVKRFGASVQMSLPTEQLEELSQSQWLQAQQDKKLSSFFCMYYKKPTEVEKLETDIVTNLSHLKFANKFNVSEHTQKLLDHVQWEKW